MDFYLPRCCPSCGANSPDMSFESMPSAESMSFDNLATNWYYHFFKKKIFFSYGRCECGLLYCPRYFSEEQILKLYSDMSDNTLGVAIEPLIKTQQSYFNFLKKHSALKGGYLEFGPDIGLFTDHCLTKGQFDSYWLLEPNQLSWPALQKKLANKNHQLFTDIKGVNNIPDASIATVVMIHVLDHLIDPLTVLQELRKKLMPGAILLFVTHDESSLLAKMAKRKWPPYCLQHPQLYNRHSMESLLTNAGYTLLACEKSWNYFPVTYLIKHFLYLLGIKKITLPALNRFQLGLKLGNIITVAKL